MAVAAYITRVGLHGKRTLEEKKAARIINSSANLWRALRFLLYMRKVRGGGYIASCHFSLKREHTLWQCVNITNQTLLTIRHTSAFACYRMYRMCWFNMIVVLFDFNWCLKLVSGFSNYVFDKTAKGDCQRLVSTSDKYLLSPLRAREEG